MGTKGIRSLFHLVDRAMLVERTDYGSLSQLHRNGTCIYGAEAAAKYKFHTTAAKLTAGQCALIAATLPNPIRFDSAHPSAYILRRQSQILRLMKLVPKFPPVEKKEVKKQKTEKRKKK